MEYSIKPEYNLKMDAFGCFFEKKLEILSFMAKDEQWDFKSELYKNNKTKYPILNNYLHYTYDRLKLEGKVAVLSDESKMCFNTGLQTSGYDRDIYAYFVRNKRYPECKQKWFFVKFCEESDNELIEFSSLPDIADYCEKPEDLIFDKRLDIRFFDNHIVSDNIDRFKEIGLNMEPTFLKDILQSATKRAEERVRRNYKVAIPQCYRDKNDGKTKIQLLLPLCLNDVNKADLALVVSKEGKTYQAKTVLPLDWAYMNARRIVTPDADWIKEI